jgi:hypothetical protein
MKSTTFKRCGFVWQAPGLFRDKDGNVKPGTMRQECVLKEGHKTKTHRSMHGVTYP